MKDKFTNTQTMLGLEYLIKSLCTTFKSGSFFLDCFPGSENNFTVLRKVYTFDINGMSFRNNKF